MARMYFDSGGASTNSGTSDNASPDLSASSDLTVVSNKTFTDADVVTATNVVTVVTHGYTSGTGVELTSSGTLPAGLTLTTLYYLNALTGSTLTFHTNVADAEAGTNAVDITAAAGGGTHTINNYTVNLAAAVDLSGVNCHHCRVTTTGTSHVITMAGGVHGLTTGDAVSLSVFTGGTMPTGLTASRIYYANVLSTTTFRVYSTLALATTGGASDINVSAAEVRTLSVFTEVASAINIVNSNVSNRIIFWVRAVSDTNNLVIVDQIVTLSATPSNWAIGGSVTASGAVSLLNSVRGGDELIFNTDISGAINASLRMGTGGTGPGNFVNTNAVFITGKTGARRVFTNTGNGTLLVPATSVHALVIYCKNMEFQSQGTGAALSANNNHSLYFYDCVISDAGAVNEIGRNQAVFFIRSRLGGAVGVTGANVTYYLIQSHFHDNSLDAFGVTTSGFICFENIFDRSTDRHIETTATINIQLFVGNTFYLAGNSGYEETATGSGALVMLKNIFKDNGNAATEANIELLSAARRVVVDKDNYFSISGGAGGVQALGFTLDASDLTGDPLFVDPDASAGSRNFGLQSSSPAKGIPYTYLNSLSVSYADLGAVQRQESASGGAHFSGMMLG